MLPVSQTTLLVPTARRPAVRRFLRGLCWLAGIGAAGCFKPDDGREPPLDRIYFPTGIALSPDGNRLYVANSDWDLQFNAGSVQVYDTERLRQLLPRYCESDTDCAGDTERCDLAPRVNAEGVAFAPTYSCIDIQTEDPCQGLGVQTTGDRLVAPGLCQPLDNRAPDLLLDSVGIGAFATDLVYRPSPLGGGRLFIPVRSDATLHWIDVRGSASSANPFPELDCGQGSGRECDADHRRGDDKGERTTSDDEELPIEPFGVDANADGTLIVTTHQTEGKVSLFINEWQGPENGPQLNYILDGLPARPVVVSAIPVPEIAKRDLASGSPQLGYREGFWLAFRGTPFIQLIRYYNDPSEQNSPFLEQAFADRLTTTQVSDIRGMAVDASARTACELACSDNSACLTDCAGVALEVFMANAPPPLTSASRAPGWLMIGNSTSVRRAEVPNDRLQVSDLVAIDSGASRTVMGAIIDEQGEPRRRVFVTSFDARSVTIYDPDARVIEARVLTGRGPTALAIDGVNALGYVAHFTDSYVGVIDLDRRHKTFGTIIRALGRATAPRGDN
jgi:hypothetical protein